MSASLLRDKKGQPIGSVGFFKDLRPLRKVENNLRVILDTVSIMAGVDDSENGLLALAEKIVTAQPVTFCSILLLEEGGREFGCEGNLCRSTAFGRGSQWEPVWGKDMPKAGIFSYCMNLPGPQVFRQNQIVLEVDIIQYFQQTLLV